MNIALISTGTELLKGAVLNTNAAYLAHKLTQIGLPPIQILTAGDTAKELFSAISIGLQQADTLLISGGLGPTRDDITLDAVARFFQLELIYNEELVEKVSAYWALRHTGKPPKGVLRQARVPKDARILPNSNGTAPGIWIECDYSGKKRQIALLPGPPREFEPMVEQALLPFLKELMPEQYTVGFLAAGEPEYSLQQRLERCLQNNPITLAYCARPEGTEVFISGPDAAEVQSASLRAHSEIGSNALGNDHLELIPEIVHLLESRQMQLVTAESCTGGGIGALLTDYAGVSSVYKGGVIVYSNEMKHRLLDVPQELLEQHGAVSAECAEAMTAGALKNLEAQCAIAVTGIAGPGGATETKPVGLVYIGVRVNNKSEVQEWHFTGDRKTVRERTRAKALLLLWNMLLQKN